MFSLDFFFFSLDIPNWSYIHRLDLVTSGILVGSSDANARRHLSMAIENRDCRKLYLAMVCYLCHFSLMALSLQGVSEVKNRLAAKPEKPIFSTLKPKPSTPNP